jgi:DNA-binding HxlR family transcriptional regulator
MDARATDVPCGVEVALKLIGGKWKLLVLRAPLFHSSLRYNELLAHIDGISAKELTRNLRELEAAMLVRRDGAAYLPTELGSELMPAFRMLAPVGEKLLALQKR